VKYVTPLNETESQTLYEMHRYHPSRRARMRAHRLLLRHQAVSMPHMARIDQVDRRSVSTWIDRWQPRGFVGFYDQPGAGRRPLLSVDEPHQVHQSLQPYPKDFKRVVPPLEPETQTRVSTKTIKRCIKKNARSGNGCAHHLRHRLSHKHMNAARMSWTDCTSVKPLVQVISGMVMAQACA
jgi:transposase